MMKDEELKDVISEHLINYWRYLNVKKYCEKDDAIKFFINDEKTKVNFVDSIEREIFELKEKQVLDIGCGKGGVLISCALRGAKVFGFDTDEGELKIAKLRANLYGVDNILIFKGNAENMPFPDSFFDLVTATSVLEHIKKLDKIIKEISRVTKPDGFCYITTPNSLYPREGHYKIFFIPYLPKDLSKIYLRLRGFNPDFFMEHVTYPYPSVSKITRIFKENGMNVENITTKDILSKFVDPSSIKNEKIRKIVDILKKFRLNKIIARLIIHLKFNFPNIHIIAQKG